MTEPISKSTSDDIIESLLTEFEQSNAKFDVKSLIRKKKKKSSSSRKESKSNRKKLRKEDTTTDSNHHRRHHKKTKHHHRSKSPNQKVHRSSDLSASIITQSSNDNVKATLSKKVTNSSTLKKNDTNIERDLDKMREKLLKELQSVDVESEIIDQRKVITDHDVGKSKTTPLPGFIMEQISDDSDDELPIGSDFQTINKSRPVVSDNRIPSPIIDDYPKVTTENFFPLSKNGESVARQQSAVLAKVIDSKKSSKSTFIPRTVKQSTKKLDELSTTGDQSSITNRPIRCKLQSSTIVDDDTDEMTIAPISTINDDVTKTKKKIVISSLISTNITAGSAPAIRRGEDGEIADEYEDLTGTSSDMNMDEDTDGELLSETDVDKTTTKRNTKATNVADKKSIQSKENAMKKRARPPVGTSSGDIDKSNKRSKTDIRRDRNYRDDYKRHKSDEHQSRRRSPTRSRSRTPIAVHHHHRHHSTSSSHHHHHHQYNDRHRLAPVHHDRHHYEPSTSHRDDRKRHEQPTTSGDSGGKVWPWSNGDMPPKRSSHLVSTRRSPPGARKFRGGYRGIGGYRRRRTSRSHSPSSIGEKSSRHHHRSASSSSSSSTDSSSSKSKKRVGDESKKKSKSPTVRNDDDDDDGRIDKKKLFEIARRNASAMLQVGTLQQLTTLNADGIAKLKSGGRSIDELVEYCKKLQRRQDKTTRKEAGETVSPDGSEGNRSEDDLDFINHPFELKPNPGIILNIPNATMLPVKTPHQRAYEESQLRITYPVSSGQQHIDKEPSKEWTPVEKVDKVPNVCSADKEKRLLAAPPAYKEKERALTSLAASGGSLLPPPPMPPILGSSLPPPPTPPTILMPPPPAPPSQSMMMSSTSNNADAHATIIDIGSIISQRLAAIKRLQEWPNDPEALKRLHFAEEKMKTWAESKNLPGQFTGSTGVNVLTAQQLGPIDPRFNAWVKKDQMKSANVVQSSIGLHLMAKMGWRPGEGLGKDKAGALEPLTLDVKSDRKGLVANEELPASNKKPGVTFGNDIAGKHPVSILMELCSKRRWGPPQFTCVESGPANNRRFLWKVAVNGIEYQPAVPTGNKRTAKMQAAQVVLQSFGLIPRDTTLPVVIG